MKQSSFIISEYFYGFVLYLSSWSEWIPSNNLVDTIRKFFIFYAPMDLSYVISDAV